MKKSASIIIALAVCGLARTPAQVSAQTALVSDESASSSLMATTPLMPPADPKEEPHALRAVSMFAVAPPQPRRFELHDLVQIIVRETSQAKSTADLDTKKEFDLDGKIGRWPAFDLQDLLQLQIEAGRTTNLPELQLEFDKEFKGEGDYQRKDDLTARITAEVIEVLPNGNLVLEARTHIKTDDEEQTMKVTGICRPEDITAANTVLSNQIHDLMIDKVHHGELRKTSKKGIISKVLETIFAF
jgi:flagellar L-ring protein precursor FlgH